MPKIMSTTGKDLRVIEWHQLEEGLVQLHPLAKKCSSALRKLLIIFVNHLVSPIIFPLQTSMVTGIGMLSTIANCQI